MTPRRPLLLDHALSLDLVNEDIGPGARIAVKLTRDAARDPPGRIRRPWSGRMRHEAS
ncbi:MAG: DUF6295 family protein [Thermocrispum sp.]